MNARIAPFLTLTIGLATLSVAWELICQMQPQMVFAIPAPSSVLASFATRSDRYWLHSMVTLREMLAGFGLALCVSLPLAWMMVCVRSASWLLQPLFVAIQCIPMFALAPIMVIWFGWSFTAIVIPTALMVFFPLVLNIYQGLRSTPQDLLDYFRINGAGRWQCLLKLRLPYAVPHIFAGFRIAAASAGIGAVAGEWAGAQQGLGILMLESRRATDLVTTFGALACLAAVSLSFYLLISLAERFALPPRPQWRRWLGLAILPLALLGCSNSEEDSVHLVLDWLPNPDHIPLYVGIERGYFADEGIPLKISKLHDPGDVVPLLSAKRVQLGVGYMPHTLRSQDQGAPVKMVGVLVKEPLNALIYRPDAGIQSIADLEGKVIGYSLGGFDEAYIATMSRHAQVLLGGTRNVNFDLVAALGYGLVDGVFGGYWNIESVHLAQLGVETAHFPLEDFGIPKYYELVLLAHGDSPEQPGLRRALQRSIDWSRQHPSKAFAIYSKANPDKSEETLAWEREAWGLTVPLLAKDQSLDPVLIQKFRSWMQASVHGESS